MTKRRYNPESVFLTDSSAYLEKLAQEGDKNQSNFYKEFGGSGLEEIQFFKPRSSHDNVIAHPSISDHQTSIRDSLRALMMIRAYRVRGHLGAQLDPLDLEKPKYHAELDPLTYGFTAYDFERPIYMDGILGFDHMATLREILAKLKSSYCGHIGVEFMHILDPDQKAWIQHQFEQEAPTFSDFEKKKILKDLIRAELFEKFIHVKYPGAKRFGLDGGESLLPALEALLLHMGEKGVDEIAMGMSHRGRLCVLANFLNQPMRMIFAQFNGTNIYKGEFDFGSGDVKYHQGFSNQRTVLGKKIHLSLTANPSHLEAVDPVTLGKVRAKQLLQGDSDRKKILGVLLHGDAAFAGQGMVAETLELSGLPGYRTGGTIHIIINNQIGFTTSPPHSRSSSYSSDVAKVIQAPIFHVNGDDPEAVVRVMRVACDYQRQFGHDVVIDLLCYRRYGHNEGDEPFFTQPLMYKKIAEHPTVSSLYKKQLAECNAISDADVASITQEVQQHSQSEFNAAALIGTDVHERFKPDWLEGYWSGIRSQQYMKDGDAVTQTGVNIDQLQLIGKKLLSIPDGFNLHPKLARAWEQKRTMFGTGKNFDWSTAEALAFGSLLTEGHHVRLSGQDCQRGTFSQRHAVLTDQENENKHIPLNHLANKQGFFEVIDSPLAEASVLGFEYGYSASCPHGLIMWEAQFGDFANGAQVIIDQFIASAEAKWFRMSALVMLLPHGHEGQGPEHTSARLERYLQLCAEENMQVVNCSTPANYFHALRRQIRGAYRKPLVMMTPKSLLRHRVAVSSLSDMAHGTTFTKIYNDPDGDPTQVKRVIICSGKIYYDILQVKLEQNRTDIALIRLEQFYPFPTIELIETLIPYRHAQFIWCQEEPYNMGAWIFLDRRFEKILNEINADQKRFECRSRPEAASPATGFLSRHIQEQTELINKALNN